MECGGNCWFVIASESFKIAVDDLSRKLKGVITEFSINNFKDPCGRVVRVSGK